MSDDDEDDNQVEESEVNMFDGSLDGSDCMMGFGPLVPTERERSLVERVKKELKHELKQVVAMFTSNYAKTHLCYNIMCARFLIGVQREDCGHKRRDNEEEKGGKVTRRYNVCTKRVVANSRQMAIPNCKSLIH